MLLFFWIVRRDLARDTTLSTLLLLLLNRCHQLARATQLPPSKQIKLDFIQLIFAVLLVEKQSH